jgi:hypothetical protein
MRMLDKKQRQNLEFNWQSTSNLIDNVDELISKLHSETCITTRQLHTIKKQPPLLQTKKLLEILSRKSVAVADVFVSCLSDIARHHVLSLLKITPGNLNYQKYCSRFLF